MELPIKVFDFFSGCGGTSKGLQEAEMDIVFALDSDKDSKNTFVKNFPNSHFELTGIENFSIEKLQPFIDDCQGHPILFSGCAPCQPFSNQNTTKRKNDERFGLINNFKELITHFRPDYVFIENVPGMQNFKGDNGVFNPLISDLKNIGYDVSFEVISSLDYGVPQKRNRLVIIASRIGKIDFPKKTHGRGVDLINYSTVRDHIGHFPKIEAGESHVNITNHRAAKLSTTNLERIKSLSEGGSRNEWPKHLHLECHSNGYKGHTDVYGRMKWDKPSPTLTTKCISLSNGRFGHPEQDRAISIREAASLQMFPEDFVFIGNLSSQSRQIGNAVPVGLSEAFGRNFVTHYKSNFPNG